MMIPGVIRSLSILPTADLSTIDPRNKEAVTCEERVWTVGLTITNSADKILSVVPAQNHDCINSKVVVVDDCHTFCF